MAQVAAVGVELLAGSEGDRVQPPLGVGQLDAVAGGERAATVLGSGGGHGRESRCAAGPVPQRRR